MRKLMKYVILIVLICCASYLHVTSGAFAIPLSDFVKTLFHQSDNMKFEMVIWDFRLPRLVLTLLVGFALGVAGAVLQGLTRNPLADPGILGVNAGAASSIVLFLLFMPQIRSFLTFGDQAIYMMMPLFGLVGGLLAATILFIFSQKDGRFEMSRFILSGIAINSVFSALTLFFSLKMDSKNYEIATKWLNGSFTNSSWLYVIAIMPWLFVSLFFIMRKAPILDYFQLEQDAMISIGIRVEREKKLLLILSIIMISAAVAVAGSISFIGLLAPHIARRLIGVTYAARIPISGLVGSLLIVFSDYLAKTLFSPTELSVGVVMAIIGIPYFFYLLIREKR